MSFPTPAAIPSSETGLWERFVAVADTIAPTFDVRTRSMDTLVDSSILFSDGLCLCALSRLFDIDAIIEAGTGFGGSTEMIARYFAERSPAMPIWSIDLASNPLQRLLAAARLRRQAPYVWPAKRQARLVAAARLRAYANVRLLDGDAMVLAPAVTRELLRDGHAVGVLIDGPKAEMQMQLADQLLSLSPLVRFVALDDVGPKYDAEGRHRRFRRHRHAVFATSDAAYFERYGWVNRGRVPPFMMRDLRHTGYGLGVLVNA